MLSIAKIKKKKSSSPPLYQPGLFIKNADEYEEFFLEREFKNNGVRSCFLPYVGKIC